MSTTVKIREKYQVTIPEDVREKIPLKVGERVEVIVREGEIVIRPVLEVPRTQAWFWGKEWQKMVSHSIEDMKAGKFKVFKSAKEAKRRLGD
jgi:AbrB family looped-hinge helix DNA binding protein